MSDFNMKLSEWVWLGAGILIAIISGYIYFFVPRNGGRNNAMALFFFIGIIFIIIGITKLFFRRADDKSVLDSIKEQPEQKTIVMPEIESKPNRIDQEIQMMQKPQAQQQNPSHNVHGQGAHAQHHASSNTGVAHTNSFARTHQYTGPVKTSVGSPNAQHPVGNHIAPQSSHSHIQNTPHTPLHSQTAPSQSHIRNSPEYSLKCVKCGNVNPGHSNYCHKCGNRLK